MAHSRPGALLARGGAAQPLGRLPGTAPVGMGRGASQASTRSAGMGREMWKPCAMSQPHSRRAASDAGCPGATGAEPRRRPAPRSARRRPGRRGAGARRGRSGCRPRPAAGRRRGGRRPGPPRRHGCGPPRRGTGSPTAARGCAWRGAGGPARHQGGPPGGTARRARWWPRGPAPTPAWPPRRRATGRGAAGARPRRRRATAVEALSRHGSTRRAPCHDRQERAHVEQAKRRHPIGVRGCSGRWPVERARTPEVILGAHLALRSRPGTPPERPREGTP